MNYFTTLYHCVVSSLVKKHNKPNNSSSLLLLFSFSGSSGRVNRILLAPLAQLFENNTISSSHRWPLGIEADVEIRTLEY